MNQFYQIREDSSRAMKWLLPRFQLSTRAIAHSQSAGRHVAHL